MCSGTSLCGIMSPELNGGGPDRLLDRWHALPAYTDVARNLFQLRTEENGCEYRRSGDGPTVRSSRRNHGRHGPHVVKDRLCPAATVHGGTVRDFLVAQESGGFRFYLMLLLPVWRSSTLQADDPSLPAVQSRAEIHTSSRHRAERRKSNANRLGPTPRRAHSVSSRNQYGRIELREAASSVSA